MARQKGGSHLRSGEKKSATISHKTSVQWRLLLRAAEIANARTPWRGLDAAESSAKTTLVAIPGARVQYRPEQTASISLTLCSTDE